MSADTLVYDMSSMTEGTPQIFVKKDWLSILDNQNGNYAGNQSIIDTSQLANSNKYMNYREAYLAIPMVLTASSADVNQATMAPATIGGATSADMAFGLKNWFGSIIHSLTLDLAGTTIIQQTPFCSLWNNFKLMTTLSYQDVLTNGSQMGFYPDDPLAWGFSTAYDVNGRGTFNNRDLVLPSASSSSFASGSVYGNSGFLARQKYIAFDTGALPAGGKLSGAEGAIAPVSDLFDDDSAKALYKSYINLKQNTGVASRACVQYSIMATIHLKHLHSFFQNVPLLKGVFMRMTLNLNQTSVDIQTDANGVFKTCAVSSPYGGVSPIMVASQDAPDFFPVVSAPVPMGTAITSRTISAAATTDSTSATLSSLNAAIVAGQIVVGAGVPAGTLVSAYDGAVALTLSQKATIPANTTLYFYSATPTLTSANSYVKNGGAGAWGALADKSTIISLAVGNKPILPSQSAFQASLATSITLNVPAYTFNPVFESAYLASSVKTIVYEDIYQYQVSGVGAGSTFNNLITNGIANIRSVLVIPFFTSTENGGLEPIQSPFDDCGGGSTSPLSLLTNFNVVVAGQNMIYNTQKYSYQMFLEQVQGCNAVNGDLSDGLTSSLISQQGWEQKQCYYYVNCARMLPAEEAVPKSVSIVGQNKSKKAINLMVFISYGVSVNIDVLTGTRV